MSGFESAVYYLGSESRCYPWFTYPLRLPIYFQIEAKEVEIISNYLVPAPNRRGLASNLPSLHADANSSDSIFAELSSLVFAATTLTCSFPDTQTYIIGKLQAASCANVRPRES